MKRVKNNKNMQFIFSFIKFCAVGTSGTLITLGTEYFLTEFLSIWYGISLSIGWTLGFLNNFFWNRIWTFDSKSGNITYQLFLYFSCTMLALIANLTLTIFLTEIIRFWYFFSSILSVGVSTFINYILIKNFVFKSSTKEHKPYLANSI